MNKKQNGFTLVEIMITITIMGILSATVAMSISGYVLERKNEEKVLLFYTQLQQMKGYALRDNVRYLVLIDDPFTFNISKDIDKNLTKTNLVQLFPNQYNVAPSIKFVASPPAFTDAPVTNEWDDNDMIVFDNDQIGTINRGIIYLQNASAKNVFYAITRPENENALKLYKWGGTAWSEY